MKRFSAPLAVLILAAVVAGCLTPPGSLVRDEGTIVWNDFEGGFWGIQTANASYDPLDLPAEFKQAGLQVRFAGVVRSDVASVHMWGAVLDLTSIEKVAP